MSEIIVAVINTGVHVVMYTYYLLSSLESTKNLITPIKPLITSMQLIQFLILMSQCFVHFNPSCNGSKFFVLLFPNFIFLIYLFGKFFIETYLKKKTKYSPE